MRGNNVRSAARSSRITRNQIRVFALILDITPSRVKIFMGYMYKKSDQINIQILYKNLCFCPEPGPGTTLRFMAVRKAAECNGQIQNWTDFCRFSLEFQFMC